MRRGIVAFTCAISFGCGARTGLGVGIPVEDGSVLDAAIDAGHDAEVMIDAPEEPALCCDIGIRKSGCQTCAADETCWSKGGSCQHTVNNCGPWNCSGCCDTPTLCADGRESGECGTQGQLCRTCFVGDTNEYGQCLANAEGGTCASVPTCSPKSCFGGCCIGNACMLGDTDAVCGFSGDACLDCAVNGGHCKDGSCVAPQQ